MILAILGGLLGLYVLIGLLGSAFYHVCVRPTDYSGDGAGVLLIAWGWPLVVYYRSKEILLKVLRGGA